MLLEKITNKELGFMESWHTPYCLAEALFPDFDNFGRFDGETMSNLGTTTLSNIENPANARNSMTPPDSAYGPDPNTMPIPRAPSDSGVKVMSPYSAVARTKMAAQAAEDFLGLRGWMGQNVFSYFSEGMTPFELRPQWEAASRMTAASRAYWDSDLGDMFGMNEFIRRFSRL